MNRRLSGLADGQAPGPVGLLAQAGADLDPNPFADRDLRQLLPRSAELSIFDPDRGTSPIRTGLIAPFVVEDRARLEPQGEPADGRTSMIVGLKDDVRVIGKPSDPRHR